MGSPSYYAIIPASVRYDKRLKPTARLLYGEITALCSVKGYCWATNAYFADLYEVHDRTVRRWLEQLREYGYIDIEVNHNKRKIRLDPRAKMPSPPGKNALPSPGKNALHSNTDESSTQKDSLRESEAGKPAMPFVRIDRLSGWIDVLRNLKRLNGFQVPELKEEPDLLSPDGPKFVSCTNRVMHIIKYLEALERGDFLREIGNMNHTWPRMSRKEVAKFVAESIDRILLARRPDYTPQRKSALNRINAESFFFNSHTGHSWLVWARENDPEPLYTAAQREEAGKLDLDENIVYDFTNLLGALDVRERLALLDLHKRVKGITRNELYSRQPETLSIDEVLRAYAQFMRGWDSCSPAHFLSDRVWRLFQQYVRKEFNVELDLEKLQERNQAPEVKKLPITITEFARVRCSIRMSDLAWNADNMDDLIESIRSEWHKRTGKSSPHDVTEITAVVRDEMGRRG